MSSTKSTSASLPYRELLAINRLITSSLDVDIVLATVTRQAAALLRARAAALLLQDGGVLKVAASHEVPTEASARVVPLGPGVMAHIRALGSAAGLTGYVGVPLVLRGETIGVLAAYRGAPSDATAEDEELLSALADQAAVALDNARIYRKLEAQAEWLRRSEAQFRGLVERLPDGVFVHHERRILYANRALAALLGYDAPEDLRGLALDHIYHPDDRAAVQARLARLEQGLAGPPLELQIRRRDGSYGDIESTAIQVMFEDRLAIIVIVRDLAERKRIARVREDAFRRLRAIVDLAPVGIVLSEDERHWIANARAQQLFGRTIDPAADVSAYAGSLLDPAGRPVGEDDLPHARALRGEQIEGVEMHLRQPDGHLVPVLVNAARVPGVVGGPPGAVVAFEDITALKELERLRIEWSAVIAHDLRQPLNSIVTYAQLLVRQAKNESSVRERGQQIVTLARRLNRMVLDLVDFSRLEARQLSLRCENVDLADLLRDAAERAMLEAPDRRIELHMRGEPARVYADADRIAQVLDNLLSNAIKYGDPGTPIGIELDAGEGQARVSVTNKGPGIEPEHVPQLFGRFQRTRDAQRRAIKGIGLGLYITRELIEAHHGRIDVEGVPGQTVTFRFSLPLPSGGR